MVEQQAPTQSTLHQEMPQSQTNTWHHEEKTQKTYQHPHNSKNTILVKQPAPSSLVVIAKLERTQSTALQNKDQTEEKKQTMGATINK